MNGEPGRRIGGANILGGAMALALFVALPVAADTLRLEPAATTIRFTLGATLHTVEGFFRLTGGEIRFDRATGEASGRIVVSARSGDTKDAKRDKKMHEQVLESATFPEIVFIVRRLDGPLRPQGESKVTLLGSMELHGTPREFAIPAVVRMENNRLSGSARFTIPFVAWGLEDPSVFVLRVKKEVQVSLDLNGTVLPGEVAPGPGATVPDDRAPVATSK